MIKTLSKYHDYVDVFDKINVNKLFKHKSHAYVIETKNQFFLSILFIICLLRNYKFFESI